MDKVYGRLKSRETDETVYYAQEFKIACADKKYCKVLEFLRTDEYRTRNIFLKDIDVTMDYSGSFDKDEVTEYLTTKKDCRIQGSVKDADRTILDNTDQVGNNCLTYMETVDGLTNIQNSRAFKTRIKENRHAIDTTDANSQLAQHHLKFLHKNYRITCIFVRSRSTLHVNY